MRLKRRMVALLTERNVANVDDVERYIDSVINSKDLTSAEIKWLKTTFRKWMINDYEGVTPVPRGASKSKDTPEWLKKALERGEQVWYVQPPRMFIDVIHHVIDWTRDARVRNLSRLSFQDALKQTRKWDEELKKQKAGEEGSIEKVADLGDGFTLVKMLDSDACKREGAAMGHCVGGYNPSMYGAHGGLYSIRDRKNNPHVTIEAAKNRIKQVQGKGNNAPSNKYMKYVIRMFELKEFRAFRPEQHVLDSLGFVSTRKGYKPFNMLEAGDHVTSEHVLSNRELGTSHTIPKGVTIDAMEFEYINSLRSSGADIVKSGYNHVAALRIDGSKKTETIEIENSNKVVLNDVGSGKAGAYLHSNGTVAINGFEGMDVTMEDNTEVDFDNSTINKTLSVHGAGRLDIGGCEAETLIVDYVESSATIRDTFVHTEMHVDNAKNVEIDSGCQADYVSVKTCDGVSIDGSYDIAFVGHSKNVSHLPKASSVTVEWTKLSEHVDVGDIRELTIGRGCETRWSPRISGKIGTLNIRGEVDAPIMVVERNVGKITPESEGKYEFF